MKRLCQNCVALVNAWTDYFQDAGAIRGWRQRDARIDTEMLTSRVNDRAALIRRQVEGIRRNCLAHHRATA